MRTVFAVSIIAMVLGLGQGFAGEENQFRGLYTWMTNLEGDWVLAPAGEQAGKATQHKVVAPMVGTDAVAMNFRTIGKGSTVQETLLPGTPKEMVTMYHCRDASCSQVKATHYCVKQNQPEMRVDPASTGNTLVYECDMNTELCRSKQNHVHKISHELSDDGQRLKTTYTSFADGSYLKDSVYQFVRK
ncbi:MAG: hypothetical protein U9R74_11485 [Pseudomonadota bacterium]|nr:hypothetical protein [Pseudomonadota bacterium]